MNVKNTNASEFLANRIYLNMLIEVKLIQVEFKTVFR